MVSALTVPVNNGVCNTLPVNNCVFHNSGARGGAVVEALRYKPEGSGIDSRWCHWNL
jgi:hypothetical protein